MTIEERVRKLTLATNRGYGRSYKHFGVPLIKARDRVTYSGYVREGGVTLAPETRGEFTVDGETLIVLASGESTCLHRSFVICPRCHELVDMGHYGQHARGQTCITAPCRPFIKNKDRSPGDPYACRIHEDCRKNRELIGKECLRRQRLENPIGLSREAMFGVMGAIVGVAAAGYLWWNSRDESGAPPSPGLPPSGSPFNPNPGSGGIVADVGKDWVISNAILTSKTPNAAANYSWHFKGQPAKGSEASVSLPGIRVFQGVGTRHDWAHTDYSQVVRLVSNFAYYKDQPARLSDLLTDPETSKFLSVEGPLKLTRQPGPPVYTGPTIEPSGDTPVTREMVLALPNNIAQREATILSWVEQGFGEYDWMPITSSDVTFYVMPDALKFGGVRINATAYLEQQIADRLDASLLTPYMSDLVWSNADKRIAPITLPADAQMSSTARMVQESDLVDTSLAKVGVSGTENVSNDAKLRLI